MRAVCRAIVASQTVDLSGLKVGELPRVSIMSLKLDVADVPLRLLRGCIEGSPALRSLIVKVGADSVEVMHPSGRTVEIAVVAGSKAAGGLASRWSAGLILDECTRMVGADESVANMPEALSVIRERLLPGAQIQAIGSPWAPYGPAYDMFGEYFGHPSEQTVAIRTTGPAGNPVYWNRKRLDALQQRDEGAWRLAEFASFQSPEANLFGAAVVDEATRANPVELPFVRGLTYSAAMDPATRSNSWTLVVIAVDRSGDTSRPRYAVAYAGQRTGSKSSPLKTDVTLAWVSSVCSRYQLKAVTTDQWCYDGLLPDARRLGLSLIKRDIKGMDQRVELYEEVRNLLENGRLQLPPVVQLREDLLRVKRKVTQTGVAIELPSVGPRHCDYAPSLVLAIENTSSSIPADLLRWASAINRGEAPPSASMAGGRITRLAPSLAETRAQHERQYGGHASRSTSTGAQGFRRGSTSVGRR
jgi:hypothetical protein